MQYKFEVPADNLSIRTVEEQCRKWLEENVGEVLLFNDTLTAAETMEYSSYLDTFLKMQAKYDKITTLGDSIEWIYDDLFYIAGNGWKLWAAKLLHRDTHGKRIEFVLDTPDENTAVLFKLTFV